jgi:outer membrane protein TolC
VLCALLIFTTFVSCHPAGAAETELSPDAPLATYLRLADQQRPALEAARLRWREAVERVPQAGGWPDPTLRYGYFAREVETALGAQEHRIGLAQRFPFFGKLGLREKAAEQAALAAWQRYRVQRLAAFEQVARAYYAYAYLARAIDITRENLTLLDGVEGVVRTRYATGRTPQSDLLRIQVEVGTLEDRMRSLEERRTPLAKRLNAALGRPVEAPLPWPVDRSLALARRERFPDVTLGVENIRTSRSDLTSFSDSGRDAWILSVSVPLPVDTSKYRAAIREADARRRGLAVSQKDHELQLLAETEQLLFELHDAGRRVDLYETSLIPVGQQALDAAKTAFETGAASFLDALDAERVLLRFQLDLARARADRGQRVIAILARMGITPKGVAEAEEVVR